MSRASPVRVTAGPVPVEQVLRDLPTEGCGAVVLVATLARGQPLTVALEPDASARLERLVESVRAGNVRAARIVHAEGVVPAGKPIAVAAAAAVHRDEAFAAARKLLTGLKGVAARRESSPA